MDYFVKNSHEHTNDKLEKVVRKSKYNKLKVIKSIDKGIIRKNKKLRNLKWKVLKGYEQGHFAKEYRDI